MVFFNEQILLDLRNFLDKISIVIMSSLNHTN